MQRRDFFAGAGSAAVTAATWSPSWAQAQAKAPQSGVDFIKLDKPAPVETAAGKIEVIEFFWYSCPHCSAFESVLSSWAKALPKDVAFKRMPIAFRDDFVPQQKLFFALEAMGLVDKFQARVFAAIHADKQNLTSAEAITAWMVKQGVDKAKFLEQFNSFSTSTKATRARQLQNAYQLEGVPALGVAGLYYTDGSLAKSMDRALLVSDFLIAQTRSGRPA
jgi:thiol:disulfide interchange protein DsbA